MKKIQLISEHKRTKRNPNQQGLYHSKVGWAEYIVEENGNKVTRHLPLIEI
jgi:hypothetical protein